MEEGNIANSSFTHPDHPDYLFYMQMVILREYDEKLISVMEITCTKNKKTRYFFDPTITGVDPKVRSVMHDLYVNEQGK
jgi:hypothetical protein